MKNKVSINNHGLTGIGMAVFASEEIGESEIVIRSRYDNEVDERDRYSLELKGKHILIDKPGLLVNHCCTPNCALIENNLGAFDFIALRNIKEGEEITFDYESIESYIMGFSDCHCGSDHCRGTMNSIYDAG